MAKQVDTEAMIKRKVEQQFQKLMNESDLDQLKQLHRNAFGTEYRGRDRQKLAMKLAVYAVTGQKLAGGTASTKPPAPPVPQPTKQEEKIATVVLDRVRCAWDEVERLSEERKTRMAEFRLTITQAKSAIADTLGDEQLPESKRLSKVEGYWQTMSRTEQKRAEVSMEYRKLIRAAQQTVKHEFDNVRQIPLFSGP